MGILITQKGRKIWSEGQRKTTSRYELFLEGRFSRNGLFGKNMGGMKWVKLFCDEWIDGSLKDEPIEIRAVWAAALAMAGKSGYDGIIKIPGGEMGFSDDQLASIFSIPTDLWLVAKARLSAHPDGPEANRINVKSRNVIEIINWGKYQSEYGRQKKYRVTEKGYKGVGCNSELQEKLHGEVEVEVEVDLKTKNLKSPPPPESEGDYILRVKGFHDGLTEADLKEWYSAYSDVIDVDKCLYAATMWLIDNPDRRKKNIKKFYGNWLRNQFTRLNQKKEVI